MARGPAAPPRRGRRRGARRGGVLTARREHRALLALLAAASLWAAFSAAPALAAFLTNVQANSSFSAYTVPTPTGVRCSGLGILSGNIVWNAVTPPPGNSVDYVITQPDARVVTTTGLSYALPALGLGGQYRVQSRISSGWLSAPAVVTVTLGILSIYICS